MCSNRLLETTASTGAGLGAAAPISASTFAGMSADPSPAVGPTAGRRHLLTGRAFRRLRRAVRPKEAGDDEESAVSEEEARLSSPSRQRWRAGG